MEKAIFKKLKSKSGESISEVLVASLIVALAFVMVASLISASQQIIQKNDAKMKEYYAEKNAFEAGDSVSTGQTNLEITNVVGKGSFFVDDVPNVNVTTNSATDNDTGAKYQYISYEAVGN